MAQALADLQRAACAMSAGVIGRQGDTAGVSMPTITVQVMITGLLRSLSRFVYRRICWTWALRPPSMTHSCPEA